MTDPTDGHDLPRRAALSAPLAALLPVPPAIAQPAGRGRGNAPSAATFTPEEILRIRAWFAARPQYRAQRLPPGIARNLARGKPLPPGIARRQAPPELAAILGRHAGAALLIVGGALVLLNSAGIVADIVENALGL
jgi:hypothetical protein